ncbi:hypothetical protein [Clavibacter capsici]|uniref:hypothetical protein n=1 Tax=Clavibacter capsici TaxID=1874630 RepID=UPI00142830ED|nr:hypothetical protein [Clavibacter capsici]QIS38644.1 hypothetical protein GW572_04525 [Clavibacter capsici]
MATPTAKELLAALRKKHATDAVVREVVIDDTHEQAIRRRHDIEQARGNAYDSAGWWEDHYRDRGWDVATAIPDGWTPQASIPQRRIDALIIASTGITAVEIKVTRSDFRRDTEEKRRAWRDVSNRFVYLTPKGLVDPDEVGAGCGLWEFDATAAGPYSYQHGITAIKRAAVNKKPRPLPFQVTRALAYRVSRNEKDTE